MSPTLWLATSALLRALSGSVDRADETDAEESATTYADATALPAAASSGRTTACRDQIPSGSAIRIAEENEPGQRLVLAGRVLNADGKTPAAGMTVYAYQADATGRYSAKRGPDDNQSPRLCSVLRTDAAGNFRIEPSARGPMVAEARRTSTSRSGTIASRTGTSCSRSKSGRWSGASTSMRSRDRAIAPRPTARSFATRAACGTA